jgi:hypothetical protein
VAKPRRKPPIWENHATELAECILMYPCTPWMRNQMRMKIMEGTSMISISRINGIKVRIRPLGLRMR